MSVTSTHTSVNLAVWQTCCPESTMAPSRECSVLGTQARMSAKATKISKLWAVGIKKDWNQVCISASPEVSAPIQPGTRQTFPEYDLSARAIASHDLCATTETVISNLCLVSLLSYPVPAPFANPGSTQ